LMIMKWNRVIYKDCMNEEDGLPTLEDKSIDLCLTDPPYNIDFKGYGGYKKIKKIKLYHDKIENYEDWCKSWFNEVKRICENIIISVGLLNQHFWYKNFEVDGVLYKNDKNGRFGSRIAVFNHLEPWFYFGKKRQFFNINLVDFRTPIEKHIWIHPCPRNRNLIEFIIKKFQPKNVIDPFLGSGTTSEVCTRLGIKWIGYEINEIYSQDINKRLKNCKREINQKQTTLI